MSFQLSRVLSVALVFAAVGSPAAWATPAQVLIIRHAEKSDTTPDLSPEGYARAQALVGYFQNNATVTKYGTPVAIYAMAATNQDTGLRPFETVKPLADALGMTVLSSYKKDDVWDLAAEVMSKSEYIGKMVLICWEHKMITPLASALGVSNPGKYSGDEFGQVWEIDFSNDQVVDFRQYEEDVNVSMASK